MTKRTFLDWLRRYAEAYMGLASVGSQPTGAEQREAERQFKQELQRARAVLLSVAEESRRVTV